MKTNKNLIYSFPQSDHFFYDGNKIKWLFRKKKEMRDAEVLLCPGGPRRVLLSFSGGAAGSGDTCHEKVPPGRARMQASRFHV